MQQMSRTLKIAFWLDNGLRPEVIPHFMILILSLMAPVLGYVRSIYRCWTTLARPHVAQYHTPRHKPLTCFALKTFPVVIIHRPGKLRLASRTRPPGSMMATAPIIIVGVVVVIVALDFHFHQHCECDSAIRRIRTLLPSHVRPLSQALSRASVHDIVAHTASTSVHTFTLPITSKRRIEFHDDGKRGRRVFGNSKFVCFIL